MAVKYTLICDGCGTSICSTMHSERDVRAAAQMECGAVSSGGKDWCRSCRLERTRLTPEQRERSSAAGHSVGTQR